MKKKLYGFIIFVCLTVPVYAQTTHKIVFKATGKDQTWTVPAGVTQIQVKLWGAGGAGDNYSGTDAKYQNGGGGGYAEGGLNVTPNEMLTLIVGSGGMPGAGPGAYGGGGSKACGLGGRGGGRSAIRNSSGTELITAGAGGGGGDFSPDAYSGNGGGGLSGASSHWLPFDGGPGTQSAGGLGGAHTGGCPCGSKPGIKFKGGDAGCTDNGFNGSGGGGYYGGGSGTDYGDGAGGGGSSFIPAGGNTIAANNRIPGNIADPDYISPWGYGGKKAKRGQCGLVVIIYEENSFAISAQSENQLSVADKSSDVQLSLYPNPSKGNITVTHNSDAAGKAQIKVYDLAGKMVFIKTEQAVKGNNASQLNLSNLSPGIYYLELNNGTLTRRIKFIIER